MKSFSKPPERFNMLAPFSSLLIMVMMAAQVMRCSGTAMAAEASFATRRQTSSEVGQSQNFNNAPVSISGIQAYARQKMSIAKSGYGACAIDDNQRVFCWALAWRVDLYKPSSSTAGGPPSYSDYIPMPDDEGVEAVSVSEDHACSLLRSGGVVCWGYGRDGRLGYGSVYRVGHTQATLPDKVGRVNLPVGTHAVGISTGDTFSCALLNTTRILCWGSTAEGRLGYEAPAGLQDTSTSDVATLPYVNIPNNATAVALAGGPQLTCAILESGGVYCWGQYAQHAIARQNTLNHVTYMPGNDTAVFVSVGQTHVCAITATQALICWGLPGSGVLGSGKRMVGPHPPAPVLLPVGAQAVAVAAGSSHTCAILRTRKVLCWGSNNWGLLGQNTTSTATLGNLPAEGPPVYLGGQDATAIAAGTRSSCAQLVNGSTICWGFGGQFGNGISHNVGDGLMTRPLFWKRFVLPPTGSGGFKELSLGSTHSCAIFMDDSLRCWGARDAWILGYPSLNLGVSAVDVVPKDLPPVQLPAGSKPTHVAAGDDFTCVVLDHVWLICWGKNDDGQLGYGNTDDYGKHPSTAPSANITVSLPSEGPIKKLTVGSNVVCVLFEVGKVWCWGRGQFGAHGGSTTDNLGASRWTVPSSRGSLVFYLDWEVTNLASAPTAHHVCCILGSYSARVVCWGRGADGALGTGETENVGDDRLRATYLSLSVPLGMRVDQLAVGQLHSCALLRNKKVVCWGNGPDGALGTGTYQDVTGDSDLVAVTFPENQDAVAIYAGGRRTCAILESGDLHCWGRNDFGELGYNHTLKITNAAESSPVHLPTTAAIQDVHLDDGTTCVLFVNHTLVCYGVSGRVGWGIEKHTSPVQLPASGSTPPASSSSAFGPFDRSGIVVIPETTNSSGPGNSTSGNSTAPGTNSSSTTNSSSATTASGSDDAPAGGDTNTTTTTTTTAGGSDDAPAGGDTNTTTTTTTTDGGSDDATAGGDTTTTTTTTAGGGSDDGAEGDTAEGGGGEKSGLGDDPTTGSPGGTTTDTVKAGEQVGENDGATGSGTAGGAAGTATASGGNGSASVGDGALAGIIIAAVLVLALAGVAVYKFVISPSAAATKAAAVADKPPAAGAVAMTNPMSRASANCA